MKLTHAELEFLSAWAREEWEPACYQLPSHRLQLAHGVSGAQLLVFIKAWTAGEGKKDQDILGAAENPRPCWPWSTTEVFDARFAEASRWRTHRVGMKHASGAGGIGNMRDTPAERDAAADRGGRVGFAE